MKFLPSWKNAALALASAGLLILAFPDSEWWWTAWFALVPLMLAVERETGVLRSFLLGWLFATVFFFGTCWWLAYAPIHYAAIPWPLAYFLIFIPCVISGIFPGIFAAILTVLLRRFGSWAFLAAPFVWVFTEFARYWIAGNNWNAIGYSQAFAWFSEKVLFTAQVGGVYLVGFSVVVFNVLVTSAFLARREIREKQQRGEHIAVAEHDDLVILDLSSEIVVEDDEPRVSDPNSALGLSTTAYLFPIYAVFFLFVNVLHDYSKELKIARITNIRTLLAVVLIPTGFSIFVWAVMISPDLSYGRFSTGDTFIIAVQPNVPMSGIDPSRLEALRDKQIENSKSAFEENLARYQASDLGILDNIPDERDAELYRKKYAEKPKVVILPESPMDFMYHDDREFQQFVRDFTTRNNVSLLFNSAEPDATNGRYFNSAVMVGADGREVAQYDKIYLLPFGEAVPVPLESLVPAFVGSFSYGREYDLLPLGDAKAGVMICFESHFGQLSREYVRNGADALIEMTNDGYLGPTPVLRQHLANAVFRAVETNRPVLRVTNVGITAYIDERGNVHDPLPSYTEGTRVWTVEKSDGSQTFYVKYGDWFAWLGTAITFGLLITCVRRRPGVAKARA
ncbi:MAG: apolipoprotein N-acyltransferase [Pyrinomonadaceae bacterium]